MPVVGTEAPTMKTVWTDETTRENRSRITFAEGLAPRTRPKIAGAWREATGGAVARRQSSISLRNGRCCHPSTRFYSVPIEDTSRGVYQFEFYVDRGAKGPPVKNISVVAASPRGDKLITLTVVAPLKQWDDKTLDMQFRKIASSFHLTS